jgi:hypothetical protein
MWNGSVFLSCHLEGRSPLRAEAMFAADPGSLVADEVSGRLGELTNMVGGKVKGLLPPPSRLSVPTVAVGVPRLRARPRRRPARTGSVPMMSAPGPLHLSIWKV